jgi:hypothetical protein
VLGLRVAKLAGYGFEEVTAPNANQQSGPEEDYGVMASEVAADPVDTLLDVQPEREFVQSKSGASTVEQGHQATDQKRRRLGYLAHFDQPANPTASRRRMPQTRWRICAANVNVMKRGDVAISVVSHGARHRKRDEKSDGRKEKPAFRPITHMRVKQIAEARVVQEQEDDRNRQKNGKNN